MPFTLLIYVTPEWAFTIAFSSIELYKTIIYDIVQLLAVSGDPESSYLTLFYSE